MEPKEAINKAVEFIGSIYGDQAKDLLLEEIQMSEEEKQWLVTISFSRLRFQTIGEVMMPTLRQFERVYKQLQIDVKTGKVSGMKIRTFQNA